MIVPMQKVFVAAPHIEREGLLELLRDCGVMHVVPVDPDQARPDARITNQLGRIERAMQAIARYEPAGSAPDLDALTAADEIIKLQDASVEKSERLTVLYRQIEQLDIWGDATLEQFERLDAAGVKPLFAIVPPEQVAEINADLVHQIRTMPDGSMLIGVVGTSEMSLPEGVEPLPLPPRDRPAIRAEAARVDRSLREDNHRLAELANLAGQLATLADELAEAARFTHVAASGFHNGGLYAVQGWVPEDHIEKLCDCLGDSELTTAFTRIEPDPTENPPTLLKPPAWARPINGLLKMLGTNPAYREFDVSPVFMIALPIFSAMLIGDGGYGLLFLLLPLLLYGKMSAAAGKQITNLTITIGALTLIWGVLSANFFGLTPASRGMGWMAGWWSPLWSSDSEAARTLIIQISFILGCVHLVSAHAIQAVLYFPNAKSLSEIGWCSVLIGMLGVIWVMFRYPVPGDWMINSALVMIALGLLLAIVFAFPEKGIAARLGLGLAGSILPALGTFSDTMSYIRLMAVGLASYYIADAFNYLGAMVAGPSPVLWIAGVPIILFGHALNIGLVLIALFAHGVRLNMLEFSNNAGVQWAGYPYEPFAKRQTKESA